LFKFFEKIAFREGGLIFYRYDEIYGGWYMFSSNQKLFVLISISLGFLAHQINAPEDEIVTEGTRSVDSVARRVQMRQKQAELSAFKRLHKSLLPSPRVEGSRHIESEVSPRSDMASPKSSRPLSFNALDATKLRPGAERGHYKKQQIANVNAQAAQEAREAELMTDALHEKQQLSDTADMQRGVMTDEFNRGLESLRAKQATQQQGESASDQQHDDAGGRVDEDELRAFLEDLKNTHELSPEEQKAEDFIRRALLEHDATKREPFDDDADKEKHPVITQADIEDMLHDRYYSPQERAELEAFIAQVVAKGDSAADVDHDDVRSIHFDEHDSDEGSITYHEENDQDLAGFGDHDSVRSITPVVLRHIADEIGQLREEEHALTESPRSTQTDEEELERQRRAKDDLKKVDLLQVTLDHMSPTTSEEKREIGLQQRALTLLSVGLKVAAVGGLAYGLYKGYLNPVAEMGSAGGLKVGAVYTH